MLYVPSTQENPYDSLCKEYYCYTITGQQILRYDYGYFTEFGSL